MSRKKFIRFDCGECRMPLKAPAEYAGKKTRCGTCGADVFVPMPADQRATVPAPKPEPPKAQPPEPPPIRTVDATKAHSMPWAPGRIRFVCPQCRGQASPEAERCPHCGHPIKRGFLGQAGTEKALNVGCLIVLILIGLILFLPTIASGCEDFMRGVRGELGSYGPH